jgi:hypothetical protein
MRYANIETYKNAIIYFKVTPWWTVVLAEILRIIFCLLEFRQFYLIFLKVVLGKFPFIKLKSEYHRNGSNVVPVFLFEQRGSENCISSKLTKVMNQFPAGMLILVKWTKQFVAAPVVSQRVGISNDYNF